MYDNEMKFVDTHEWVRLSSTGGENIATIGITAHAQELLGDLVYIELPSVGKVVNFHEVVGVIESVKAASDLYSPVAGEVIEVNDAVIADPTLANTDPHGEGWLFKAKLTDIEQMSKLMSAAQYKASIGEEE